MYYNIIAFIYCSKLGRRLPRISYMTFWVKWISIAMLRWTSGNSYRSVLLVGLSNMAWLIFSLSQVWGDFPLLASWFFFFFTFSKNFQYHLFVAVFLDLLVLCYKVFMILKSSNLLIKIHATFKQSCVYYMFQFAC